MNDEFNFDGDMDDSFDSESDYLLEQQELEDFAQDGYFENMEPLDDGMWG